MVGFRPLKSFSRCFNKFSSCRRILNLCVCVCACDILENDLSPSMLFFSLIYSFLSLCLTIYLRDLKSLLVFLSLKAAALEPACAWITEEAVTGRSITHLEMLAGVLRLPASSRRSAIYLRDPDYVVWCICPITRLIILMCFILKGIFA